MKMVINKSKNKETDKVKFVSYTGRYPCLCNGVLTLEIDGEEVKFGHDYKVHNSWKTDGNYEEFWSSGGSFGFAGADTYVNQSEWCIDYGRLPEQYRKYAEQIDRIFNENVEFGCCGGCL